VLVISDTSPVRALHYIEALQVLGELYGRVLVPSAVAAECVRGTRYLPAVPVHQYPFIETVDPSLLLTFDPALDAGEVAAISLAVELRADRLLIDEAQGRHAAAKLGLEIVGVLGVLLEAKGRALIPAVQPLIARLRPEFRFFVSDAVVGKVLRTAGEA